MHLVKSTSRCLTQIVDIPTKLLERDAYNLAHLYLPMASALVLMNSDHVAMTTSTDFPISSSKMLLFIV